MAERGGSHEELREAQVAVGEPPIRLAIIGVGWWGSALAEAAKRSGRAELVSCYSRTTERRVAFAQRHHCRVADSLQELLDDREVEAVVIATPHSSHAEMVRKAADAGKHVLVEKPFALSIADGCRAAAAAQQAGVILQVGYQRRHLGGVQELKRLTDHGELGDLQLLEGSLSMPEVPQGEGSWRRDERERPLGGLTATGVHVVDLLLFLGGPIVRVSCFNGTRRGDVGSGGATACLMEFSSGALGYVGTSLRIAKIGAVAVHGTKGSAWSEEDGSRLFRQGVEERTRREESVDPGDPLLHELIEFATCVRGQGRPQVGAIEALQVVAVLEAAIRSRETGQAVEVELLPCK